MIAFLLSVFAFAAEPSARELAELREMIKLQQQQIEVLEARLGGAPTPATDLTVRESYTDPRKQLLRRTVNDSSGDEFTCIVNRPYYSSFLVEVVNETGLPIRLEVNGQPIRVFANESELHNAIEHRPGVSEVTQILRPRGSCFLKLPVGAGQRRETIFAVVYSEDAYPGRPMHIGTQVIHDTEIVPIDLLRTWVFIDRRQNQRVSFNNTSTRVRF